jgi:type II secretory pathway pseudopilin PulG
MFHVLHNPVTFPSPEPADGMNGRGIWSAVTTEGRHRFKTIHNSQLTASATNHAERVWDRARIQCISSLVREFISSLRSQNYPGVSHPQKAKSIRDRAHFDRLAGIPAAMSLSNGKRARARRPVCRSAAFTVLELIMVIAVLSILLAIAMPTIKTAREAALRKQAAAGATALVQAAIRYKNEYGFWPGQVVPHDSDKTLVKINPNLPDQPWQPVIISRGGDTTFDLNLTTGDASIEIAYVDNATAPNAVCRAFARVWQESPTTAPNDNPLNPRGISFLDLQHENNINNVAYPDPWGRPYVLLMGLNPRTMFTHEIKDAGGNVIARHSVSNQIAFAFSRGFPGLANTNLIYSAGVSP